MSTDTSERAGSARLKPAPSVASVCLRHFFRERGISGSMAAPFTLTLALSHRGRGNYTALPLWIPGFAGMTWRCVEMTVGRREL